MSNRTIKKIWILIIVFLLIITIEIGIMFYEDLPILIGSIASFVLLSIVLVYLIKKCKKVIVNLDTMYTDKIDKQPWKDYPRPQLVRKSYYNLNGEWDYIITKNSEIPNLYSGKILVPFPIESKLSNVNKRLKKGEHLFYRCKFSLEDSFIKDKVILHFQAVDQICKVYINQQNIYVNYNGYIPFEMDIKPYLQDENELIIEVIDDLDNKYPYGKQKVKNNGMWYTPVSGIWQTVWIESVSKDYIERLIVDSNIDNSTVTIKVIGCENVQKKLCVTNNNREQTEFVFKENEISIGINNPILWSPENPHLYYFTLSTDEDYVESYFAFRKIGIGKYNDKEVIYLNNKPYFNNGLLDQGYYSDGIYLPASIDQYIFDLMKIKEMGFNTIRKHIKIEPLIWYSLCDKLGILVWQDMVNNSKYSFFKTTLLPTIGFRKINDNKTKVPQMNRDIFIKNMEKTVELLYNCPSIILWTIFNEGWGQFESAKLYNILKELDKTRLIDSTSGWFDCGISDFTSLHVYFKKFIMPTSDKPVILSEFGGFAYKVKNHVYNLYESYGYDLYDSKEKYFEAYKKLYEEQIIPNIENGLSAAIYTQLSDVEDEINGLLTYDRKVCKFDEQKVKEINNNVKFK